MQRPIASSVKKKFEEERARRILAYLYPEKYQAACLSESPDIINEEADVGTEVTSAQRANICESISIASMVTGKRIEEIPERRLNKLGKKITMSKRPDGTLLAGTQAFWSDNFDFDRAIASKIQKLNARHFQRFKENNLFIYAWMIDDDELTQAIQELTSQSVPSGTMGSFDSIFVFDGERLVEVRRGCHITHKIPLEIIHTISEEAFKTVVGVSRNEYYGR